MSEVLPDLLYLIIFTAFLFVQKIATNPMSEFQTKRKVMPTEGIDWKLRTEKWSVYEKAACKVRSRELVSEEINETMKRMSSSKKSEIKERNKTTG